MKLRASLVLVFLILPVCYGTVSPSPVTLFLGAIRAGPKLIENVSVKVTKAVPVITRIVTPLATAIKEKFDDTNSEEVNNVESLKVYPPKLTEKLLPPACGRVFAPCNYQTKYRTYDGSCNNLLHPEWGVPNSTYSRLLPAVYNDKIRVARKATDKSPLPGARKVRTELFPSGQAENQLWPINIMQWGQFMAHDMSLLKEPDMEVACCTSSGGYVKRTLAGGFSRFCFPIKVPPSDPTMGAAGIRCMNFTRSMTDRDMGCAKGSAPAQQINTVTAYLDLSNVYGNNEDMAKSLRSLSNGELKYVMRGNRVFPPMETNRAAYCPCSSSTDVCYKTGDSRSNQNPQLAILQILYFREHNRLARGLKAINPSWNDETLYQEARRINIAANQFITYSEWAPILLGRPNLQQSGIIPEDGITTYVEDYDSSKNASISNEHANAAFRHFHTNIADNLQMMDNDRNILSTIKISDWFNRPKVLEEGTNIEQLTVGMVTQKIAETDQIIADQISDRLLACPSAKFGIDMKATDIQRDRDHGLAYYNDYRKFCNLTEAQSFDDYLDLISVENVEKLKTLYKSYKDVDLSVGGSLEFLKPGAQVGPTFYCIIADQLLRTRQADRFWFEHSQAGFTLDQVNEIRKASSSSLFCNNADGISQIQPFSFILIFQGFNTPVPCSEIVSMDLTKWKV